MLLQRIKALELWKKKYIYIYFAVMLLLLTGCLLLAAVSRESTVWQGEYVFATGVPTEEAVVYEGIALKPGVYRIGLQYRADKDYSGMCSAKDDALHPGALMTNGEHLYGGLGSTGYQLWLFVPTDNLQITVSYGGEGSLSTGDLVIANTGQLWTMLGVIAGVLMLLALLIGIYIAYDRQYQVSGCKKEVILFLVIITFLASIPQLRNSVLGGADLTYHLQRIEGVKDGLMSGQFPVRLEPEWLYGHGYADAVFYCNTLLYLPALLRMAGFTVTISYNLFCIALNLATAWIAWYTFSKIFKDDRIGLMCSALYTLSFIRIYKLAVVGALGEGSAITFLPLIFYGLYRVFTEDAEEKGYQTAWIPVALGYAGVVQCHVLTCEITAFVTLLVCLICIRKISKGPVFVALLKGAMGAVTLSFWYLVPFVDYYLTQNMHIRHVSGRTIQGRGLYPAQLLINSWSNSIEMWLEEKGLEGVEAGCVGVLFLLALVVFAFLWLGGRLRKRRVFDPHVPGVVWEPGVRQTAKLSALLACLLLAMSLRIFPWDTIQASSAIMASLVSSLQFPNRFLGWATVFLCMVFGFCLYYFRGRRGMYLLGVLLVAAGVGTGSLYLMHHALQEQTQYTLHNEESMGCGYISGAEYLVEGTDQSLLTFAGPVAGEGVTITGYERQPLAGNLTCANTDTRESYVDVPLLLYKGYRAYGEKGEELAVSDGANHLVRVNMPAGYEGDVQVRFVSPWYWRLAELVTIAAVLVMARVCINDRRREQALRNAGVHFYFGEEGEEVC